MSNEIAKAEQNLYIESDSYELPPPDIVAYNELRSCADLFRMHTQGILEIQPEFQRDIVWKNPDQTRFIDSLIKQLPIPSMCFSLDYKSQKWQVIDGLQRISTIIRFLEGNAWSLSRLEDVDQNISGQSVQKFLDQNSELYKYYVRVQNLTLPITVLRCDYSKPSHTNYLFTIFHRLNTGGLKLNNQEIRNCIYSGTLNNMLKDLNKYSPWRKLNRMKKDRGYRFTKQELILRLFAFHDNYQQYGGRLAKFLNDYMLDNKNLDNNAIYQKEILFKRTVDLVYKKLFSGIPPIKLQLTIIETVLVGASFNLTYLESITGSRIKLLYQKMLDHEEFSEAKLSEGLSGKTRVIGRINAAKKVFSGS
jgi:uncharacterized protein DUF262